MKPDHPSSGIDRRALLATAALLPAFSAPLLPTSAPAQTVGAPLPSWRDGGRQVLRDRRVKCVRTTR